MNESHEGEYSTEGAPQSEKRVKIEEGIVVQAPISEMMKQKIEAARQKTREVDAEIERRLWDMRQQLNRELRQKPDKNYNKITREVGTEAREALRAWLSEIHEGKHGRGDLVVVESGYGNTQPGLTRVVTIENPADSGMHQYTVKNVAGLAAGRVIKDNKLYRPNQADSLEQLETYYDVEQFLRRISFVEVDFSGTSEEELDELYEKLKENGWLVSSILQAFPKEYKPTFQVGAILNFGSCSHHSGEIYGKQIVLPSGRFAVVSKYEGEYESLFGGYRFWGVLADPNVGPSWSAKQGGWEGSQLDPPTLKEIAFLKGMNVEFPDSESLEEGKKMLGSGEEEINEE